MFVDASAIIAILAGEAGADALADRLEQDSGPITSPLAVYEAVVGLCRQWHASVFEAELRVRDFLRISRIEVIEISRVDGETALQAFDRYGKGRGHPAQLNLGDCFAYAMAKNRHAALLYVGNDFAQTDLG